LSHTLYTLYAGFFVLLRRGGVGEALLEEEEEKEEGLRSVIVDSKTLFNDFVGSCTSHPEVLGSIPKREEPGKTGRHPVLKYRVPYGSQPRPGWVPDNLMVGIRSPDGLVVGLAPATLEFWVRFPNERNQGKQGATLC